MVGDNAGTQLQTRYSEIIFAETTEIDLKTMLSINEVY